MNGRSLFYGAWLVALGACKQQAVVPPVPEQYRSFSTTQMQIHSPQDSAFQDHHKVNSSIQVAMDIVSNDGNYDSFKPTVVRVAVQPNESLELQLKLLLAQGMKVLDGAPDRTIRLPGGKISEFFFTLDIPEPGLVLGFVAQEVGSKRPKFGQAVMRIGEKSSRVQKFESFKKEIKVDANKPKDSGSLGNGSNDRND